MNITQGTLLQGRIRYAQPATGFRTGIEPVLLAATLPARPGQRVLEAGTGAGAAMLCLLARCPDIAGMAVERDTAMAGLAAANMRANGFDRACVIPAALPALPFAGGFDHAMANPPWHAAAATASTVPRRDAAKRARPGLLESWILALAAQVRRGGTVTLILPASQVAAALTALGQQQCGGLTILPLWPRTGIAAKLALVRGVRGRRSPGRMLPGLTLHGPNGYTPETTAILGDGQALPI